jgi:signal transduction histidine kinase
MRNWGAEVVDYFIPAEMRQDQANLMKVRTFVLLHILGPAMGHSVILFLWKASKVVAWQFWVIEISVASFWLIPLLVKLTKSLFIPAILSVQALVFLSLFGSFFYGGISSPFLPWFLIALLLGFFYLAERAVMVLVFVTIQLALFVAVRLMVGTFPTLLPMASLTYANLFSILAAITYTTLLSVYYEAVIRDSGALERATCERRMQMEALGEAMQKAENASRQKSIFLAKISHELRTPLNAVIGYSEMLRENLGSEGSSAQRAVDLERINAAGRHLLALVTDVLDLTRIEAHRLDVSIEMVDVAELIRDVTATAAPLVAKKRNQLQVTMPRSATSIQTDPLKLRQCILNLLSNAAKFTSHGTITLNVTKRNTEAGRRLLIEVRDTGIGMSEETLSQIFKDFSQGDLDTTRKFGGTGLGLALTQRFCALMGGSISVTSRLGQGSDFVIDIPCEVDGRQPVASDSLIPQLA